MNDHAIRKIVIVGGGTAGWMAAAALSKRLDRAEVDIVLIESDEIGIVGVGEATIPHLAVFNAMAGINEDEFLAACQGTFKLGIEFVDWGLPGERYFHPFGPHGSDLRGVHFHQLYLREAKRRPLPDIREWSMSAVAAELRRFARPGPDARLPLSQLVYAFHFDASLYARFLRGHAEAAGVKRVEGKIVDVALDGSSGHVQSVTLSDGRTIDGELFIDCSGFRGLLIEQKLETGYDDWSKWLPCDRAVAVPTPLPGPPEPFVRCTARSAGWQWRIPLQHRMGNGLVYSSSYISREDAEATLLQNLEGEPRAEPRHLGFTAGRRRKAWNANVVSLGLASGFLEPLESTSIHLIQAAITRLIDLLPDGEIGDATRDDYNARSAYEMERIRDFIILHYHANQREGEPFWDGLRAMDVPEPLQHKIDQFRATARVVPSFDELFDTRAWIHVMIGQNIIPQSYHPIADIMPEPRLKEFLDGLERSHVQQVGQMPDHAEFVARFGPIKRELLPV